MSLDKAIIHGKEKRKQYRGSKAIDCTCRNHGSWCGAEITGYISIGNEVKYGKSNILKYMSLA